MKKIAILLIAVMVISIGFVDVCIAGSEPCGTCDGTGKCNRCDGTGWEIWQIDKCDKCGGTGDCQTCGGTGYIETGVGGTGIPGFEIIALLFAIAMVTGILLLKRKSRNY
ncbi:MAG: hypothetical protein FK734_19925 [Asgard group archaeon]|nr:hypothetical protein [Asgard group archaeon]